MVERTPRGVRWLADQAHLPCERLASRQRLFRLGEVLRLVERRAEARRTGVRVLRPKKVGVRGEPRQLSLFRATLPEGEVRHARSRRIQGASDNGNIVNSRGGR
jgi:hypothetical protein